MSEHLQQYVMESNDTYFVHECKLCLLIFIVVSSPLSFRRGAGNKAQPETVSRQGIDGGLC